MSFTLSADSITVGGGTVIMFEDADIWSGITSDRTRYSDVLMKISISKFGERVKISSIKISIPEVHTEVLLEIGDGIVEKLLINDVDILTDIQPIRMTAVGNSLLPDVRILREQRAATSRPGSFAPSVSPIYAPVRALLRSIIDKRIGESTVNGIASRLIGHGRPDREYLLQTGKDTGKAVQKNFEALLESGGPYLQRLFSLLYANWVPSLVKSLNQYFRAILTSTLYIGPARARSERYYRYQELAVSEIDPDGKNFPMFLNSLTSRQTEDFSSWVEKLFGYGVRVSRERGHISINLMSGGVPTNIVDVGYGVSQILPVLGQIWWAKTRQTARDDNNLVALLAIEQPELHLHPAHQALLADALVGEIGLSKDRSRPINYLVETHSETLINRFGEFIAEGRFDANDVQVVIFDATSDNSTKVRTVGFDRNGTLVDWPFGFFQPQPL